MIPTYDIDYAVAREGVERKASLTAADPSAREAHRLLAERYADRVWGALEARCAADLKC